MRAARLGVLTWSCVAALACTPVESGPDAGVDAGPAVDPGLLDPIVPFALAGRVHYNSPQSEQSIEDGPVVGQTIWFNNLAEDPSQYQETGLLAVAALPELVVVVYPAAAHDGLAIAWGGLDSPWQTQPLFTDRKRPLIGAVDAVVNPTNDGVLVAVRERFAPGTIWLLEWKPGGSITREEVPRPGPVVPSWWTDRCPDLRLGTSRRGDVDLLYMHDGDTLMQAHRPAGSRDWELAMVTQAPADRSDVGCANRIAYDEGDRPQVLTMLRYWPEYERAPDFPDPDEPPPWDGLGFAPAAAFGGNANTTIQNFHAGFVQDGVGRWRDDLHDYKPVARVPYPHYWQLGGADLEEHPEGYLTSGVILDRDGPPHALFQTLGFQLPEWPRLSPQTEFRLQVSELDHTVETAYSELKQWGNVDKITVGACGDYVMYGREWQLQANPALPNYFGWANGCHHERRAPVVLGTEFARFQKLRGLTLAHGRRAYDVGVCVHEASGKPAICVGGYFERGLGILPPLAHAGPAPYLVSSSITEGAVDVPADTTEVVFTLARPIAADETVEGLVARLADADRRKIPLIPAQGSAEVHVPLGTLTPGALHRVSISISRPDGPWSFLRDPAPAVTFRVAGGTRAEDPRVTSWVSGCEGDRTEDTCELANRAPYAQGESYFFAMDYDVQASGGRLPKVWNGDQPVGGVTVDSEFEFSGLRQLKLTWRTALLPDTTYTVTIDPEARNHFGAKFRPEDRRWTFRTTAAP